MLKPYVSCSVGVVLAWRKKWAFHLMRFINSSVFSISLFKYDDFDAVGMFFVEYSKDIRSILIHKSQRVLDNEGANISSRNLALCVKSAQYRQQSK